MFSLTLRGSCLVSLRTESSDREPISTLHDSDSFSLRYISHIHLFSKESGNTLFFGHLNGRTFVRTRLEHLLVSQSENVLWGNCIVLKDMRPQRWINVVNRQVSNWILLRDWTSLPPLSMDGSLESTEIPLLLSGQESMWLELPSPR